MSSFLQVKSVEEAGRARPGRQVPPNCSPHVASSESQVFREVNKLSVVTEGESSGPLERRSEQRDGHTESQGPRRAVLTVL